MAQDQKGIFVLFMSLFVLCLQLFVLDANEVLGQTSSETIQFEDPQFEQAIRKKIDRPEGPIKKKEVRTIKKISISANVNKLVDIVHFPNVEWLSVDIQSSVNLKSLTQNKKLKHLFLRAFTEQDKPLLDSSSRKVFKKLSRLTSLSLDGFHLDKIKFLKHLKKLKHLNLEENSIEDLSVITQLKNLESLDLSDNKIRDISGISSLSKLKRLDLSGNYIKDISPLQNCSSIQKLDLAKNDIKDISPLKTCITLRRLIIHKNKITDVNPLSSLSDLVTLRARQNQIKKGVEGITGLKKLKYLRLAHNRINELSTINGDNLNTIDLRYNDLKKIPDLSSLENLEQVNLHGNPLVNINNLKTISSRHLMTLSVSFLPDHIDNLDVFEHFIKKDRHLKIRIVLSDKKKLKNLMKEHYALWKKMRDKRVFVSFKYNPPEKKTGKQLLLERVIEEQ